MLISPPFLPPRGAGQNDADWLAVAMCSVASSELPGSANTEIAGSYPVSLAMGWHGGSHLVAPVTNNIGLPVRAIADGTVIYVRPPREHRYTDDEALNYGAPQGERCWTSNGVVVIKHETDIGATAEGQAVSVVFYSLYMHLEGIAQGVRRNQRIYRKAEVGTAGYIYGQPHRIHFEIFCDDDNLQRLVGRNAGDLPTGQDGRSSVVFGELYFQLPAGTEVFPSKPLDNDPVAHHRPPGTPAAQPAVPLGSSYTTTEIFHVGLRYAAGDGAANQRGHAWVTTYRADGTPLGEALPEANAEYTLYARATAISNAYPATPATGRPAPSAVYELLRFGRIIGPDALTPADVPHWRHVRYPGGQGWVNLNAANVRKFSDADFPHWKGWGFIDDSADQDSRCDSPTIRGWFDRNQDGIVDAAEPVEGTRDQALLRKLEYTLCKFPTEWNASTLDRRWNWLKKSTVESAEPLSDDDFKKLMAHGEAMCFWEDIPAQTPAPVLPENPWRFHPRRFIQTFRKCGWMKLSEMTQLLPRRSGAGGQIRWDEATRRFQNGYSTRAGVRSMPAGLNLAINQAFRKYLLGASPLRQSHFFGQVFQETGALTGNTENGNDRYFRTMYEVITPTEAGEDYDNSPNGIAWRLGLVYHTVNHHRVLRTRDEYTQARPGQVRDKARALGNLQAGDGPRFRGRGLIQLTGRGNYISYGTFRARNYTDDPNPLLLAGDAYTSTDVSLKYWVSREYNGININRHADAGTDNAATERVTRAVNGGTTHIANRREYFGYVWGLLNDAPVSTNTATLERQLEG